MQRAGESPLVSLLGLIRVHYVLHVQWENWPDKSVPTSSETLLLLCSRYLSHFPGRTSMVHCSAGIGRTGTLLAVHIALEEVAA